MRANRALGNGRSQASLRSLARAVQRGRKDFPETAVEQATARFEQGKSLSFVRPRPRALDAGITTVILIA